MQLICILPVLFCTLYSSNIAPFCFRFFCFSFFVYVFFSSALIINWFVVWRYMWYIDEMRNGCMLFTARITAEYYWCTASHSILPPVRCVYLGLPAVVRARLSVISYNIYHIIVYSRHSEVCFVLCFLFRCCGRRSAGGSREQESILVSDFGVCIFLFFSGPGQREKHFFFF